MDDNKRADKIKGLFLDILIVLVILGCIVGIVLTIFTRVNTQNVRNQMTFHIDYTVDRISASAGSTIEFGNPVWLDSGIDLGTFQTTTLAEALLVLDNGEGTFVTEAYPDDNVRSMTGKIYATGILSANNTLLLDGTVEILPGQTLSVHTRYADFELRILSVEPAA